MRRFHLLVLIALLAATLWPTASSAQPFREALATGWTIQTSAAVKATGETISQAGFSTAGWHAATVPGTVVGALVEEGTFKDP